MQHKPTIIAPNKAKKDDVIEGQISKHNVVVVKDVDKNQHMTSVVLNNKQLSISNNIDSTNNSSTTNQCTTNLLDEAAAACNNTWWANNDGYNLSAFEQNNGDWPVEHPLPLPNWASQIKETLNFDTVYQYEEMNGLIEAKLHRMLEETHYNTVNNFIDFYKSFKRTRRCNLKAFFQFYEIPINRRDHMCVSLAFEIIARILEIFPHLHKNLYVVSCEESVMSPKYYIDCCDEEGINSEESSVEKEHALVAMKISIAGRQGVMILDPGYHVARAVTVMNDQCYPHTGWFIQSDEKHCKREYCYNYNSQNNNYIEWCERETRAEKTERKVSLIYIEHAYRTAIDVTVRRNLVYDFRSLLARDAKGRVFAGIYFPLMSNTSEAQFTVFYEGPNGQSVKSKLLFSIFKNSAKTPENVEKHIEQLSPQLHIAKFDLLNMLRSLAEVVLDEDFIKQVLSINEDINEMSADN